MAGEFLHKTVGQVLDEGAAKYPDHDYLVFKGRRFSYAETKRIADQLAAAFLRLGIQKGDKVTIWMASSPEWVLARFALAKIGAVMVAANTRYKTAEIEYILRQSDSTTLLMMDRFLNIDYLAMLDAICPELATSTPGRLQSARLPLLRHVVLRTTDHVPGALRWADLLELGTYAGAADDVRRAQAAVGPEDIADLIYTSGTTGFPKGAMCAHGQILQSAFNSGERQRFTDRDRLLVPTPLFHIFGCLNALLAPLTHGAAIVLLETFEAGEALAALREQHCTAMYGTPTMFIAVLDHPDFPKVDTSAMRTGIIGGAPVPLALMQAIVEKMGAREMTIGYGMTESSAVITQTPCDAPIELRVTTVGPAMPDVEIKIVDPRSGADQPHGEQGEICFRGYTVMKGYYKMPAETAKAIDQDGWMHTGDLGVMQPNGYLNITGRLKDMYISGGFNVYPVEIEEVLFAHPKVKSAYVVGVPDQRMGELGLAVIELREGETATEQEIVEYCRARLANFKVPRYVKFAREFPMTATGKVQKFALREQAIKELDLEDAAGIQTA